MAMSRIRPLLPFAQGIRLRPTQDRIAFAQRTRRNHVGPSIADDMRNAMRHVPQPVSVVVARLRDGTYHGATLSSFSSIALHPEPLVSFSLRLPSRLADALRPPPQTSSKDTPTSTTKDAPPIFSINILSGRPECETTAHRFSQAQSNHEAALSDPAKWEFVRPSEGPSAEQSSGEEGIPVARKGMTTLLCRTVRAVPLGDLTRGTAGAEGSDTELGEEETRREQGSMLFIARVVQVLQGDKENVLVYKDGRYLSV